MKAGKGKASKPCERLIRVCGRWMAGKTIEHNQAAQFGTRHKTKMKKANPPNT